MVIYLEKETDGKRGTKVACDEAEAKYDESHGWTRYTVEAVVPMAAGEDVRGAPCNIINGEVHVPGDEYGPRVDPVTADPGETLAELREAYKEKFGKAPHHKKRIETLRKELGI